MPDQPADLLAAAAQRIREGDHRIDIALRGPLAAWLDDAADGDSEGEHDPYALDMARAVLGQDGA
ncbi:MAG: hypothetical protein HOW97_39640 [Catenulispora sp.]|nr:hypothetical protein [Catenulispora sp.]NUS29142.1 hypothetical protein [Streptomyces sp.]